MDHVMPMPPRVLLLRYRKRGYTAKAASDAEMQMLFEPSENHVDTDYSSAYAGLL